MYEVPCDECCWESRLVGLPLFPDAHDAWTVGTQQLCDCERPSLFVLEAQM